MENANENSISLNKYISSTGICSRREADAMIAAGAVTLNGEIAQKGNRVSEGDIVKVKGKALKAKPKTIYIALNKPQGIVCTTDLRERQNIVDFVKHQERLFPIGRLDKGSEGLIFLTNDGDIVNKILRAGNNHEKEYIVTVNQRVTSEFTRKMSAGVPILDTVTKRCKVIQLDEYSFKMILTQGLNRQIRRMCEYFGYEVTKLVRTRIMNVKLDRLPLGKWRNLTEKEMQKINALIASSSKTEEASKDKHKQKKHTPKTWKSRPKRKRF
jgi:23S rRNA pseudouridine2604 synthase